jgi:hypothetical protein
VGAAQERQALAGGDRRQPAAEAFRIVQGVQPLEHPQPGGLDDVGRVRLLQAVARGDGPDEGAVPGHQLVPGLRDTPARGLDELGGAPVAAPRPGASVRVR